MNKTIWKFRAYTIWQDKAEAVWLSKMAEQGFQVKNVLPYLYIFEKAEPEQVTFCHDYTQIKKAELDNYLQLYQDAGWQYVMRYGNWFYFKSKDGKQIYSDEYSMSLRNINISRGLFKLSLYLLPLSLLSAFIGEQLQWDLLHGLGTGLSASFAVLSLVGGALWFKQKKQLQNKEQ